jgi:uncharacterized protein
MNFIKKHIIIFILLLIVFINSFSQSNYNLISYSSTNDSSKNKLQNPNALKVHRQYFWDNLPEPINWVSDFDTIFTNKNLHILDSTINQFNTETGIQIGVITLDTFCVAKDKFNDLSLHIANVWGVGMKAKDNGILISISKGYRLIRINNGLGIEKLISDKETQSIIDNYFTPSFKKGDYYEGVLTGLTEYINLIKRKLKK